MTKMFTKLMLFNHRLKRVAKPYRNFDYILDLLIVLTI